jgi:uncharacterized protein (TIGR02285 family)
MKLASLLLLALALWARGAAAERVSWIVSDFPPGHVISGERAGTGMIDIEISYFADHLPEFIHETKEISNIRAWSLLKEKDGICLASALDLPQRRQIAVYSRLPGMAILAPEVLTRREEEARFAPYRNAAGEIDLGKLATDSSLRAARTIDRPLGAPIEQFTSNPGQSQLTTLPTSSQAVMMLDKNHVDYTFGYANEITYYRSIHPDSAEMMAIPIAGQPRVLYTYVVCSDGPIGRRVIARIDELLAQAGTPPPYFEAAGRWYDPADFRELAARAVWPH